MKKLTSLSLYRRLSVTSKDKSYNKMKIENYYSDFSLVPISPRVNQQNDNMVPKMCSSFV